MHIKRLLRIIVPIIMLNNQLTTLPVTYTYKYRGRGMRILLYRIRLMKKISQDLYAEISSYVTFTLFYWILLDYCLTGKLTD